MLARMSDSGGGPALSIVVPVLRDAAMLARLLSQPRPRGDQWIVVSGSADDEALAALRAAHPDVEWLATSPGRGVQMAAGAERASADWIVFLHADTSLGEGWREDVARAAATGVYEWGCFALRIASGAWQARVIEAGVRVRVRMWRLPYGDQGLFFHRETLAQLGGVPRVPFLEDVLLARRFGRRGAPWRSKVPAVTSARRWERDGWWRRSARNVWTLGRFLLGASPASLAAAYEGRTRPTTTGSR